MSAVPPSPAAFPPYSRRFFPLLALGLLGVLGLLPQVAGVDPSALPPGLAALPRPAQVALLLLNPLLLVAGGAALGAALAHRVGLGSVLAGTAAGTGRQLGLAAATGLALAALLVALELAWRPFLGVQAAAMAPQGPALQRLWLGVLYGGLAEEIIMRWGLMSLLAWALSRTLARRAATVPAGVIAAAALLSALVFAAGHLPALAALAELTPATVARTLSLNTVAGLVYGWLFWRRHLEAAMAAHAATHVGFVLLGPLL